MISPSSLWLSGTAACCLILTTATGAAAEVATTDQMTAPVRMAYETAPKIATNVEGIRGFRAAPDGFDPLNASDTELAAYGFPPRPDAKARPGAYARWAKAMAASHIKATDPLKATGYRSTNMRSATQHRVGSLSATPTGALSYNWSGIANAETLAKWNKTWSVYYVESEFNVPAARQAFGACDGGWDLAAVWNGIDGFNNGDVLQGGTLSAAYCSDLPATGMDYYAWVEWYPSYQIIKVFPVNPGDDMFVETWDTSATNGYVYVVDETTGVYTEYNLVPSSGEPGLVGNSAEYIVERPCCTGAGNYYPLANYIADFWDDNGSYLFNSSHWYPGQTSSTTYLIDMIDDGDTQNISHPLAEGPSGIVFHDENCAYSGGCAP